MLVNEQQMDVNAEEKIIPIQIREDAVSPLHKCKSGRATKLCIFDFTRKLKVNGNYDIGGTYSEKGEPELWFYITATTIPGYNYLLNLFVCHRKIGNIYLRINEFSYEKEDGDAVTISELPMSPTEVTFRSSQPDQHYYISTYSFSESDLDLLRLCTFYIHFSLNLNPKNTINMDYVRQVKINHNTNNIFKAAEPDIVLVTATGTEYPAHKAVLAAHSPVLRDLVKGATSPLVVDITDDVMESVLQFLYTGTIKDILKQDCTKICTVAEKYKIDNLVHFAMISLRKHAGGV